MSLQTVLNMAESITLNRRRAVGIQYTRNEIARVSVTPTRNPWRLTVKVTAPMRYEDARSVIEQIDITDRSDPETIVFSSADYLFGYQGSMNATNLADLTVSSFTGTNLVLTDLPTTGAASIPASVIFKKGDFIQVANHPYPFTITSDVVRGSSSTVTLSVHRPNFISSSVVGNSVNVGNSVEWQVICTNMPTYTISPGGSNALVTWNSDFELFEYTGNA